MAAQPAASVNCPNCRNAFTAPIHQIVDAQMDPQTKMMFLAGRLNAVVCPHCGFTGALNSPFLYHDAELEIAFVFVPMDLGVSNEEQQRIVGDLTNRLMNQLPPEARKGYLLQPRTFLTQKSLIDAVLEKDEPAREVIETRQRKMALLDQLREIDPQDSLAVAQFVGENDKELDAAFFQILSTLIEMLGIEGATAERDLLVQHQTHLLEKSNTGQLIRTQQAAVAALSANPTRETLIEQLIAAEDRSVREALLMVGRQLMDYAFFQSLTERIDEVEDEATKDELVALRKEIQEIRDDLDAMARAFLDSRAALLRDLMMAKDPREMALRHLPELDAAFFSVLNLNMQQAERDGRMDVVAGLEELGNMILGLLNEMAPPEIQLLGRLAGAEDDEAVRAMLQEERGRLDDDFLKLVQRAAEDLGQEGNEPGAERLRYAAEQIEALIAA